MKMTAIAWLIGGVMLGMTFLIPVPETRGQHPDFQGPGYPGEPIRGYFQPVQIRGPEGTKLAMAIDNRFVDRHRTPHAVGLLIGGDYRLRMTDIPFHPGKEIFPTVKIIARTFPPQGLELEYPILIDITQDDVELALNGQFITRVIYLEDPLAAVPLRGDLGQPSMDVAPKDDPIDVASTMGRPVAIVRLGGRVPSTLGQADPIFFHGCPAWLAFDRRDDRRFDVSLYQNRSAMAVPGASVLAVLPRSAAPPLPDSTLTPASPRVLPSRTQTALPLREATQPRLSAPLREPVRRVY